MIKLKGSTKRGQDIISRGSAWIGNTLNQVYHSYSYDKEKAYNWCYDEYLATENHEAFGICSKNTFGFTCSWLGTIDGENILRYETKDNSYIVYLDR